MKVLAGGVPRQPPGSRHGGPRTAAAALQRPLVLVLALLAAVLQPAHGARLNIRVAGTNASSAAVASAGPGGKATAQREHPRVYFLFLAVDKVSNLDIWRAFFARAPAEQYRAYVHCKLPSCISMVKDSPLAVVPTVPSYYCTDLVSPMNQLVAHALGSDSESHFADKFAFISDSTLPAKPFSEVYATLAGRRGSDFCVFPSNEWADMPSANGGMEIAVKHHQWITLERGHAETALALWSAGKLHDFMTRFRMNLEQYTWSNNTFADGRNWGCLDEFWHMAAIYGTLAHTHGASEQRVELPLFVGAPLTISHGAGWQGECDTFVIWSKYLHLVGRNPFEDFFSSLDAPSIPHGGNVARPGWWDTISSKGIAAIRRSSFLFVRKFIDAPRLADGTSFSATYGQIVLGIS